MIEYVTFIHEGINCSPITIASHHRKAWTTFTQQEVSSHVTQPMATLPPLFFFFFLPILCCLARRGRDPYLLHAGVKIGLKSQSYFNFWPPTSSSMHVQRTKKTLDNPKEV